MVRWRDACADVVASPRADSCTAHRSHRRRRVDVVLDERPVPDCPATPGVRFEVEVFDAFAYQEPGYCTGDDEVSRSVIRNGSWEPFETALAWCILSYAVPGVVLDVGCHVGWYSILAGISGRECFGVAADPEQVDVARGNVVRNGLEDRVTVAHGWIDATTRPFSVDEHVRLAKLDIEGAEADALRMLDAQLDAQTVDFVLMEASPEFGLVDLSAALLLMHHYQPFLVPDKGAALDDYERHPLAATYANPLTPTGLAGIEQQATVLWTPDR